MTFTDALWGGQLKLIQLDPVSHESQLRIDTIIDGAGETFVLLCRGVTDFRFQNSIPDPWTYAEVTEAYASRDHGSGTWLLELTLWSEKAGLTLRCASIDVHQGRE